MINFYDLIENKINHVNTSPQLNEIELKTLRRDALFSLKNKINLQMTKKSKT